jgi:hypothetical protein
MKDQLDAVARALHDWPEGSRNAYTPHSLAGMVTALRQRLERAEGALREIAEGHPPSSHFPRCHLDGERAMEIARAALEAALNT